MPGGRSLKQSDDLPDLIVSGTAADETQTKKQVEFHLLF